jgi:hypothetical protein
MGGSSGNRQGVAAAASLPSAASLAHDSGAALCVPLVLSPCPDREACGFKNRDYGTSDLGGSAVGCGIGIEEGQPHIGRYSSTRGRVAETVNVNVRQGEKMRRYFAILVFLSFWHYTQAADMPRETPYVLNSIVHTTIPRASDMALAPDEATSVTSMNLKEDGFLKFDAVSGELLSRHLKRDFNPQKVFWLGNQLLLLTDTRKNPVFRVLDSMSFELLSQFELEDWRLYRITSATLRSDGSQIWIGTMPTEASSYGTIDSALFVLDVVNGKCRQIAGDPPNKGSDEYDIRRFPWMVCADDAGSIVAIDPKNKSVLVYKNEHNDSSRLAQLDFTPSALPRKCKRYLPVAGENRLHVIDLKNGESIGDIPFIGNPLSVCVDAEGTTAFVSTAGSSTILQFDLRTLKNLPPIDLSRPDGVQGIADSARGKDVSDLSGLGWASNPNRIIAFGYHGYIYITAMLERKEQTDRDGSPAGFPLPSE